MLSMFEMLLPLVAVCFVVGPLWFFFKKGVNQTNAKQRLIGQISIFVGVFVIAVLLLINGILSTASEDTFGEGCAIYGLLISILIINKL